LQAIFSFRRGALEKMFPFHSSRWSHAQPPEDPDPNLKWLFMSRDTEDVIAHHGVLDKGAHFIQKPFSIQDLSIHIRKVLDEKNWYEHMYEHSRYSVLYILDEK
jgi:hypothetical protein